MIKQALQEWQEEGKKRFGEDFKNWKFICPVCKHISSVQDFIDLDKDANNAYQACIGRHNGKGMRSFNKKTMTNEDGCDWAAFGLFGTLGRGRIVINEGKGTEVFDFADTEREIK